MTTSPGYGQFAGRWEENAQLALDTIDMKPTTGIPLWMVHTMQWSQLEEFSGNPPGSYPLDSVRVYLDFQLKSGVCFLDQWIPENPLSMKDQGYGEDTERGATTGAREIIRDDLRIDSPEAVVEHMERFLFPQWEQQARELERDPDGLVQRLIGGEIETQRLFGMNVLKGPYSGFYQLPGFLYGHYGYAPYFMAYALYPEVMESCFKLQADLAVVYNRLAARAILEGALPRVLRLDHDMADSRGTLVNERTLDDLWLPHFARALQPFHEAGIRLLWHCDGNLMALVPRLLEVGLGGFQGFQYEEGMDYERICRMKTRAGDDLLIIAGVSVTRTLPHGTASDVKRELEWLVEYGPQRGLFLGCSSTIAPGVSNENLRTLIEGFDFYRRHGRSSEGP
jgi:hypothetical protein